MDPLQQQYEDFPYPPIPFLALPSRSNGNKLEFSGSRRPQETKILIVGAGTFEPLAVAQANPKAKEIVAIDFSRSSLNTLIKRNRWYRLTRLSTVPLRTIHADIDEWHSNETFDYILASNVLHHLKDPTSTLVKLSKHLNSDGAIRIVTYPKASRIWMREASKWLRAQNCPPNPRLARKLIKTLPSDSPIRSIFESHQEIKHPTGLKDAFLNERENPLSPLEWQNACAKAGLILTKEDQAQHSTSSFLTELLPQTNSLSTWEKLEILDRLLELCANPVLWLKKGSTPAPNLPATGTQKPEHFKAELGANLLVAAQILNQCDVSLDMVKTTLQTHVGPRYDQCDRILPGLSMIEYDWDELLSYT